MNNKIETAKENNQDSIKNLRKRIFSSEAMNVHSKNPKNDIEMADKLVRLIKSFVDEEVKNR